MKNKLNKFNIDEGFIEEAHPDNFKKEKRGLKKIPRLAYLSAALLVVICAACCWLFIPFRTAPASVAKYSDSPYYSVIQTINKATFSPPTYKNNWQLITSTFKNMAKYDSATGGDMAASSPTAEDIYSEVTDNQVMGVIEGDRFKRTQNHIFYLDYYDGAFLKIYSIEKENSRLVSSINMASTCLYDGETLLGGLTSELFLSSDGRFLTVICQVSLNGSIRTRLTLFDCGDAENPAKVSAFTVNGKYNTARLSDGKLLLVSNYSVDLSALNFNKPETFVPSAGEGKNLVPVSPSKIIEPKEEAANAARYTAIYLFDAETLSMVDCNAFLDYHDNVYATKEAIYLTRTLTVKEVFDYSRTERSATEIYKTEFSENGFSTGASNLIYGYIKDQYSLDVYGGYLRAVTTVRDRTYVTGQHNQYADVNILNTNKTSASLYVLDDKTLEQVTEVYAFAPEGETVRSVRFDGTNAYVCTSIENTDPVFFFDLTDVNQITYTDTGTIPGFSTSLINLKDGILLGVGREDNTDLKLELYTRDVNEVVSVDSYVLEHCAYSTDYKSYYISREDGYFGLAVESRLYSYDKVIFTVDYLLFRIENAKIDLQISQKITTNTDSARACIIDGYLYILHSDLTVVSLGN